MYTTQHMLFVQAVVAVAVGGSGQFELCVIPAIPLRMGHDFH